MSELESYIGREEEVVNQLAEAARQVPEDKIHWKPCDRSLPWLYLIHHTSIHRWFFMKLLKGEPCDFPGIYTDKEYQPENAEQAAGDILKSWEEFKRFLRAQPADFLEEEIDPPWGGPKMSVKEMLWWTYEENVHHRGQAWIYARMNGLIPPAVWGTERVSG